MDEIADGLIEKAGLEIGLRFLDLAHETFALIATQPEMGWACRLNHRALEAARVLPVLAPFEKYLIFYEPGSQRVEILRVVHGARDIDSRFRREGLE